MVIVTKMEGANNQKEIKQHKTKDFRRIVRKYCREWDCYERLPCFRRHAIVLAPNNGAKWRLHIELITHGWTR